MLCISCPVMSGCQDIHQPKVSSFLNNVLTRQNKQSRHIFRLAIDIQNLSIFWVLYPGWFYKVIVEAHKIYGLEIMFAKPWVILEISDFVKICCFLGQDFDDNMSDCFDSHAWLFMTMMIMLMGITIAMWMIFMLCGEFIERVLYNFMKIYLDMESKRICT